MGLFDRLRGRRDEEQAGSRQPTAVPDAVRELVDDYGQPMIDAGFAPFETVVDTVLELADDEDLDDQEPVTRTAVVAEVRRRWQARRQEQQSWPAVTDADRLRVAFARLEAQGVAALMDFSCCQGCAPGELVEVVEQRPVRPSGYVYFHQQDTESMVEDGSLYLAYGSTDPSLDAATYDAAAVAIGRRVVDVLREEGFDVRWNGTIGQRICVDGVQWRNRLTEDAPGV